MTRRKQPNLQDQKFKVGISDEFLDQMLMYDYKSSKKGRSSTSLLIQRQPRQPKAKKEREEEPPMVPMSQSVFNFANTTTQDILKPPPMV